MNMEVAREYCLSLKNTTECFPFDDVSLVFKVENRMYALLPLDADEPCLSLKCHTDYVEDLRERYDAVEGAYHFNKKYWNTIYFNRDMPAGEIKYWIRHSYKEVISKLPKKIREKYTDE
ncbi:MAG: MmcQ/YjbR family DNA-binding protein [Tannerellaceae bacterium]|jgi:predicted DNA-binding protein (MmcQ/YjbR family)|nr:MmcQ/YjbR family DNA-binding protein [Tannerellaceae bacterium]